MKYHNYSPIAEAIATEFRDNTLRNQVVALAIKGGSIINFGVNKRRYSSNSSYFHDSMHAEIDLLKKLNTSKLQGIKFYIYRFNNIQEQVVRANRNAKPCLLCQHILKNAGITKVFYIDDNNKLSILKNRDMIGLIGDPSHITHHFLKRYNAKEIDSKFIPINFVK
jgi:deoxycytidylate deaminase